jgi:hypothetical protein
LGEGRDGNDLVAQHGVMLVVRHRLGSVSSLQGFRAGHQGTGLAWHKARRFCGRCMAIFA